MICKYIELNDALDAYYKNKNIVGEQSYTVKKRLLKSQLPALEQPC